MQPVPSRAVMLRQVRDRLAAGGIDEPEADARALLLEATGLAPLDLITGAGESLDAGAAARLEGLVVRRLAGEPVGRIRGQRLFWCLPIRLSVGTLEPRHDSEALIEEALSRFEARRGEALRLLDLGTGSGCLLLALLSEWTMARGLGIDLRDDAVRTASANAALNGLAGRSTFRTGSWTAAVREAERRAGFDLVISNPPYIPAGEIAALAPEVRSHDPRLALDGGPDRSWRRSRAGDRRRPGRRCLGPCPGGGIFPDQHAARPRRTCARHRAVDVLTSWLFLLGAAGQNS
jgi:release factor glutamine methyltransferase